jgi:hypothetical protein
MHHIISESKMSLLDAVKVSINAHELVERASVDELGALVASFRFVKKLFISLTAVFLAFKKILCFSPVSKKGKF